MKMHIGFLLIDELFFAKYLTILNSLYYRERTKKLYWNYVGFLNSIRMKKIQQSYLVFLQFIILTIEFCDLFFINF
jgi:hypothetical protein